MNDTNYINVSCPPRFLWLGREQENNYRFVTIDCANWFEAYPNATIVAYYQPYAASDPYPLVLTADGTKRIWHPTATELVKGNGELQIVLMLGDVVGTSAIIPTRVDRSLISNAEHPADEAPSWTVQVVQDVTEQADRAEEAASHYPKIVNGVWYVWSVQAEDYVSTGIEAQGEDGYSPTVTVTKIDGGHRVTITDVDGAHTFDVMDGDDGSGAVQSVNGKTGVVVLDASDVGALPDDTQIPTKVSDLTNDSGFVTAQQAAASAPVQSVNGKTGAVVLGAADVHALPDSTVIPPTVTEQTVSGWGFTKNTGTYSKPSGGIPKTDLASDVRASLGKADSALQEHQSLAAYRTASAQDTIDAAQDAAIAAKYTKPSGGIPASDLASGVIPTVPQMATQSDMSDWTSGKTVDAATLKADFIAAAWEIDDLSVNKADKTELPDASTSAPVMDGTAAVGTSTDYARADHIHPSDTTRLSTTGNAYRTASIPMGHLDATSTATVMTATVNGITELRDGVCMWLLNGVITSASGFTLNVNGLGAKPCYSSLAAASRSTTIFNVNYTMLFVYNSTRVDGGCWDIVYGVDTNTTYTPVKLGFGYGTCTTAAATAAKTASISSYALTTGGIVSIKFDNDVPAGATLNITSKGAKAIYHRGAAITADVIRGGDTATFIYSTYYHLISIDRDEDGDTLPAVTASDNGKFLRVVSGAWAAETVPTWQGGSY